MSLFQVSKAQMQLYAQLPTFYVAIMAPCKVSSSAPTVLLLFWRQIKQIYSNLTEAIELLKQIDLT